MARRGTGIDKAVKVLVGSMIGALIVYFVGDALTGTAWAADSATAEIVEISPLLVVALGLYAAFQYM